MGCIYIVTNKINGKQYIGKTGYQDASIRWNQHKHDYTRFKDRPLYRAFLKYGIENFDFSILYDNLYSNELDLKEIEMITLYDTYKNGYNATLGGEGKMLYDFDDKELIDYYNKTLNIKETAEHFGCCYDTMSVKLKELGVKIFNKGHVAHRKRIYCSELNMNFESVLHAAQYLINLNISKSNDIEMVRRGISRAVNKKRNTYLKMHWYNAN